MLIYHDPNEVPVVGFFSSCTPFEGFLSSTLNCLHDNKCLELLLKYFPFHNRIYFNLNDSILFSKKANLSFYEHLETLFIDDWSIKINYSQYFQQCKPSFCSYETTDQKNIYYAITILVSLYGGFTIILHSITPHIISVILKFKSRSLNTNVNYMECLRKYGKFLKQLNLFKVATDRTINGVKQQQILTLIITESNPSLDIYKNLENSYSNTLKCPCSLMIIPYKNFLSLTPIIHEMCSSDLVDDRWITVWKTLRGIFMLHDWRDQASSQFQLLSDLCRLTNRTIDDAVRRFLLESFAALNVLNKEDFEAQLYKILNQFFQSITTSFRVLVDTTRLFTQVDQPYMRWVHRNYRTSYTDLIINLWKNETNNKESLNRVSFDLSRFYIRPFVYNTTFSHFPLHTTIKTIVDELMIEQWNPVVSYERFYQSCAPKYCSYSRRIRTKNTIELIMSLVSMIGGLTTSLKLITPYLVKTITKDFREPPFNLYEHLKFVTIEPRFHQICSSPFASDQWRMNITFGLTSNLSTEIRTDYRRFLSAHLQFLHGLCQLSTQLVNNFVDQFLTSLFITTQLLPEKKFFQRLNLTIEQGKSNIPIKFNHLLFLIRRINHGNAIISTYGTNFEYIVPWDRLYNVYAPVQAIIYNDNCSCGLHSNCITQANFTEPNSSKLISLIGLKIGCTPSESFLASTLECFYNQSCIDHIEKYTLYTNSQNSSHPLSITANHFSINTTVSELIQHLFVDEWLITNNYITYFQQCKPFLCSYTYIQQFSVLYIVTTLLALQGGLTIVLKWISPKIIQIIATIYYRRKQRTTLFNLLHLTS
ncbi:hypothetical protein I4U23_011067 [Adineta vaga]|nr:hypothetical protein I4U23_011067 [Adineta vaga]